MNSAGVALTVAYIIPHNVRGLERAQRRLRLFVSFLRLDPHALVAAVAPLRRTVVTSQAVGRKLAEFVDVV